MQKRNFALIGAVLMLGLSPVMGKTIKIFILAGQSNMVGHGMIGKAGQQTKGTLFYLAENDPKYKKLLDDKGMWVNRDDVFFWSLNASGDMAPGFGKSWDHIGPELGFGVTMGEALDEKVIVMKAAWGGRSLSVDFRPPSAGGEVGKAYKEMIEELKVGMKFAEEMAGDEGAKIELVGFGWHQGWNDGGSWGQVGEYASNFKHLVADLRAEFESPNLLVVIANSGMMGNNEGSKKRIELRKNQLSVAKDSKLRGTIAAVDTVSFYRGAEDSPGRQGFHWNQNAECYYLVGESMANAMLKLMSSKPKAAKKPEPQRTFRNTDGSRSFKGRFVSFDKAKNIVVIDGGRGRKFRLKLEQLHPDDQKYVTQKK